MTTRADSPSLASEPTPSATPEGWEPWRAPVSLEVPESVHLQVTPDDFERLCRVNRDLRLERTAAGALIVMAPAGTESGARNLILSARVYNWSEADGTGIAFDSSAGFTLPNGAIRAPDASWMTRARWESLPREERDGFARVCPDFVAELTSPSDRRSDAHGKLREYIEQGARLGWLIDPRTEEVEIHRPDRAVETLVRPETLSGEDVLPGFVLALKGILFD